MKLIPGINQTTTTDLPVLKPMKADLTPNSVTSTGFTRWLANLSIMHLSIITVVIFSFSTLANAANTYSTFDALDALWRWMPFLLSKGFFFNILISLLVMIIGTILGILLGLGQISLFGWLRKFCWTITQFFRNSPWLVLLFVVMLAFPFQFKLFGFTVPVPDWLKAVIGLSLPIMANISEIVRGAVLSVPSGQWEAAESLAYTRTQTLWKIILPQSFKRMIPPWMPGIADI